MSRRTTVLAWSLCAVVMALYALGWTLTVLSGSVTPAYEVAAGAALLVLPVVGALVASRCPGNAIGWLFCGAGLLLAVANASYGYAAYALRAEPPLPGATASAWLTSWVFLPAVFGVPSLLFLLFPDGRPLGPRWRPVVVLVVVGLVLQAAAAALRPGALQDSPVAGVENPLGLGDPALAGAVELAGWTLGLAGFAPAIWSLVLRYRRAAGEQRLQLRWFALSAVLFGVACLVSIVLFQTSLAPVGQVLVLLTFAAIPVAAGVAILRYRLYDIDVVINRALVYGSLTATLAAVYLASVLVLQLVLSPLTDQSDLAVAASTLAAAAIFRPARARIQAVVDRRFFRGRYDATRTLESFTGRLRQEVDLDSVSADLRGVVRDTVHPAHVSLWLRGT